MEQIKTDVKPLNDFFENSTTVEDIAEIIERQTWNLIFFELNSDSKSIVFPDDLCYLKELIEALKKCKTIKTSKQ